MLAQTQVFLAALPRSVSTRQLWWRLARPAMLSGPALRLAILAVLVLQTSLTVLTLRYARTHSSDRPFLGSSLVLLTECVKYLLCLALLCWQSGGVRAAARLWRQEVAARPRDTAALALPASLYTLQNNLLILALTHLDAATYQVTYQLKILTTAGFSVLLLGRKLEVRQWLSLLLLTGGVALVQLPGPAPPAQPASQDQQPHLGILAVITACFSSGFAGVFYEKLVKQSSQPSVVIRNLQLGLFSLLFSLTGMLYYNYSDILEAGLLQGYTAPVVAVILLQAVGGLVVAATIKYADNILKGFATSISIIVSTLCSWFLLEDLQPGPHFILGSAIVTLCSLLYGVPVLDLWSARKQDRPVLISV